jgi:prepilin-type N-terminal cleavage/methylation domain-containing protein
MRKEGLYGWFNKNLRGKKGQKGFTLIELLVVVTILGVLAAIVTLSLVGLTTNASVQSCNAEYKTVQSALDAYMATNNLTSLPGAQVAFTNDMSGGAIGTRTALFRLQPKPERNVAEPHAQRPDPVLHTWDQFEGSARLIRCGGGPSGVCP